MVAGGRLRTRGSRNPAAAARLPLHRPQGRSPPGRPHTGVAGWRRFNAPEPALSTAAEQVLVFFATNAVGRSDEVLLRHYQRQLAAGATSVKVHAQLWLMLNMVTPTHTVP